MQIYLARDNVQAGPYTLEQVNNMLASGEVILTDLAWHEGMSQWQPLGDLTGGKNVYNPNETTPNENKTEEVAKIVVIDARTNKKKQEKRITVDELYGRKPANKDSKNDESTEQQIIKIQVSDAYQPLKISADILASIGSRMIASIIDWGLFVMIFMPISLRIDPNQVVQPMTQQEFIENTQKIAQTIPEHVVIMTWIFLIAYFVIQTLLLVRRGQTIGKLLMGIRILDFRKHQLASATNVVLLRAIVTTIFYLTLAFPVVVAIDYVFMLINRNNRSLHDKLAGTIVVKANDNQLKKKDENKNNNEKEKS